MAHILLSVSFKSSIILSLITCPRRPVQPQTQRLSRLEGGRQRDLIHALEQVGRIRLWRYYKVRKTRLGSRSTRRVFAHLSTLTTVPLGRVIPEEAHVLSGKEDASTSSCGGM